MWKSFLLPWGDKHNVGGEDNNALTACCHLRDFYQGIFHKSCFLENPIQVFSPPLLFLINLIKFNASQFNKSLIVLFNSLFSSLTPSSIPATSTRAKRLTISRDFYCSLFNFFTQLFLRFMHDNCFVKILISRERD